MGTFFFYFPKKEGFLKLMSNIEKSIVRIMGDILYLENGDWLLF